MSATFDKRWTSRAQRWVSPGVVFSPREFVVEAIRDREAKPFVCREHYSGTYPAARLAVGLFRRSPARLVGVAVFSVPMNQRVIPARTGLAPACGVELGRFVCTTDVAYNGESWFLARAFAVLRTEKPAVAAVLSYADPVARSDADGAIVKPEHWGTIYQASNAHYLGRAEPRTLLVAADGSVLSPRLLSKLRNEERGWQYAERAVMAAHAPNRADGETLGAWVNRISASPAFRRVRHPGNLTYVFGLTPSVRQALAERSTLPYPKRERVAA